MEVTTHMFDASVFEHAEKHFTTFQIERVGYYVIDPDSTKEHMILNRTLTLRERTDMKKMKANGNQQNSKKKQKKTKKTKGNGETKKNNDGPPQTNWSKTDIRVGYITKAWKHPDSEKLWCEEIDVGEESGVRQIASGLRAFYPTAEEVQGRKCLVVCNLKPAKLGGFKSAGMVLCASNDDHTQVEFVDVPKDAKIGERVFLNDEKEQGEPVSANSMGKKKVFKKLAEELKTNDEKIATWQGKSIMTSAGPCTVPSMAGVHIM